MGNIYYSQTYTGNPLVVQTFTPATRADWVNSVVSALLAAGWTNISGSGTDRVLGSGTTPDNLKAKVRIWDPGSGNCARVALRNWNETLTGDNSPAYCQPGLTYKIVASAYQFAIWVPGSTADRTMVFCSVPKLEPLLTVPIWEAAVLNFNGKSDTAGQTSLRNAIIQSGSPTVNQILNGMMLTINANAEAGLALKTLAQYNQTTGLTWMDDSVDVMPACIRYSVNTSQPGKYIGYLWDALLVFAPFAADAVISWDNKNWIAFTNNNISSWWGTLCLLVQ